jgi:hypothetical protein
MSHIADMGAPATGNVRSKLLGDRTKQAFDLLRRNFSGLLETAEVEVRSFSCTCVPRADNSIPTSNIHTAVHTAAPLDLKVQPKCRDAGCRRQRAQPGSD